MHRITPAVKSLLDQNINSAEVGRLYSLRQVDPVAPSSSSGVLKQFPPPKFRVGYGFDIVLVRSRIDEVISREGQSRVPWPSLEEEKSCRATQKVW